LYLAYAAVFFSAVTHGVASVFEQIGTKRESKATSLNPYFLVKLVKQMPYLGGLTLDTIGYLLSFWALRKLPLFLVQAGVAASIAVTALTAKYVLKAKLRGREWRAIACMLVGLFALSTAALPESAPHMSHIFRTLLLYAPFALILPAAYLSHERRSERVSVGLAALGGIAFSGAAIIGRVIILPHPLTHILADPLLWSFIGYNILGMLTFSIALQKGSVTSVNATLFSAEMLVPTLIGLSFLGDQARPGYFPVVLVASLAIMGATLVLA
jgi:drug/metabolite transporter (DMT)-like permease